MVFHLPPSAPLWAPNGPQSPGPTWPCVQPSPSLLPSDGDPSGSESAAGRAGADSHGSRSGFSGLRTLVTIGLPRQGLAMGQASPGTVPWSLVQRATV